MFNMAINLPEDTRMILIAAILGAVIGVTGFVLDYCFKSGGLVDRLTDKEMVRKYGADWRTK